MGVESRTKEIDLSQSLQKRTFIYTCILKGLELCSVPLLWGNPSLLTLVLIITSAVMIWIGKSKEDICLYVAVFFIGSLSEVVAIFFGAWKYTLPDILGIPIWLPFAWGGTGVSTKRIYLEINRLDLANRFKKIYP